MTGFMYILRCRDGSYYVGSTTSGDYRIQQHKDGLGGDYTRRRLPVELVYGEEFPTLHEAFLAERQVKGWSRQKKEALIRGDYDALPELSWSSVRGAQELARRQTSAVHDEGPSDDGPAPVLRQAQDDIRNVPAGDVAKSDDARARVLRQAQDDIRNVPAENEPASKASPGDTA